MNKEQEHFLKEGITRYKQATAVYFNFRKEIQNTLQEILKSNRSWGNLEPDFKSVKSTSFGQDYPLLNARIKLNRDQEELILVIAINWYQSETDFPFFSLWIENNESFTYIMESHIWDDKFEFSDSSLRYHPDQENYDIQKDFNSLLNAFTNFCLKIKP